MNVEKSLLSFEVSGSSNSGLGNRMLKVNHAGENGAINIYSGQIFVAKLLSRDLVDKLIECRSHEERHREIFASELRKRKLVRCRSFHLCAIGGLVLGLVTGLLGRKAIAATTIAVEAVVLKHLNDQIERLNGTDDSATFAIQSFVDDEQAHHDLFLAQVNTGDVWVRFLTPIVSSATEFVIWLGMKL